MPKIDFNTINEHGDLVPDGVYVCAIEKVTTGKTENGDEMWRMRLRITEDEFAGKRVFDSFVFSPAALPRIKLACRGLGIDTTAQVDLTPTSLMGRLCRVVVEAEAFQDKHGRSRKISKVVYDGYLPLGRDQEEF